MRIAESTADDGIDVRAPHRAHDGAGAVVAEEQGNRE